MRLPRRVRQWLMQTGRSATPPVVLDLRRVFIVPSRVGLLYGFVLIVMYLGAVNYNLGLGHALVFLLASLALTGMVHGFRNLAGLRIHAGKSAPVFAGDNAEFQVRIENDSDRDRPSVSVRRDRGAPPVDFGIPARTSVVVSIEVASTQRGWLNLEPLTLSTTYPLGLFYAWSHPQPPMRCLVYPKPIMRPLPPPTPGANPGTHGRLAGDDDFAGLRLRQAGDSPRHVAWKAFARDPEHRPLMVKQFASGSEPELWLDSGLLPAVGLEVRLSILTGWVLAAERTGARYGLRFPGGELEPDCGAHHAEACLRLIALHGIADDRV